MSSTKKISGHHGTSIESLDGIKKSNFKESGSSHWFGRGAYFFVQGINSIPASDLARLWAIDQAWDNKLKKHTYETFTVIEAIITFRDDNYLDLTETEGLQLFNEYREKTIEAIIKSKKRLKYKGILDSDIFSLMRKNLGIEVVKGHVYIMFADIRRSLTSSRIPNCTILCVDNCEKNIIQSSIREVSNGSVI